MNKLYSLGIVIAASAVLCPSAASAAIDITAESTVTVSLGSKATLTAYVTEGAAPFTIAWTDSRHNILGTTNLENVDMTTFEVTPTECGDYYATVTDADGNTDIDTCRVIVTGQTAAATFENLWLESESSWAGPDYKGEPGIGIYGDNQMNGMFLSGAFSFSNTYSLSWYSWEGFAFSNSTATKFDGFADQYNNVVGGGHNSSTYAVAFSKGTIGIPAAPEGTEVSGLYIINSAYTMNTILNGDAYAHKFEQGDWLKVIFTGNTASGDTTTVEYYLADYRDSDPAKHYAINTWQWVDLSALGTVTSISFALEGSDSGIYGLNTPAYFCIDDVNVKAPATGINHTINGAANTTPAVYDMSGRRINVSGGSINASGRGLRIIRNADGTVTKVFTK